MGETDCSKDVTAGLIEDALGENDFRADKIQDAEDEKDRVGTLPLIVPPGFSLESRPNCSFFINFRMALLVLTYYKFTTCSDGSRSAVM